MSAQRRRRWMLTTSDGKTLLLYEGPIVAALTEQEGGEMTTGMIATALDVESKRIVAFSEVEPFDNDGNVFLASRSHSNGASK